LPKKNNYILKLIGKFYPEKQITKKKRLSEVPSRNAAPKKIYIKQANK